MKYQLFQIIKLDNEPTPTINPPEASVKPSLIFWLTSYLSNRIMSRKSIKNKMYLDYFLV